MTVNVFEFCQGWKVKIEHLRFRWEHSFESDPTIVKTDQGRTSQILSQAA